MASLNPTQASGILVNIQNSHISARAEKTRHQRSTSQRAMGNISGPRTSSCLTVPPSSNAADSCDQPSSYTDHTTLKETKQTKFKSLFRVSETQNICPKNGAVLSNQVDLDGGKRFKLVRKSHSKSIKINSEWEKEKQALLTYSTEKSMIFC